MAKVRSAKAPTAGKQNSRTSTIVGVGGAVCVVVLAIVFTTPDNPNNVPAHIQERKDRFATLSESELELFGRLSPNSSFYSTDKKLFSNWCKKNSQVGGFCLNREKDDQVFEPSCNDNVQSTDEAMAVWERGLSRGCAYSVQNLGTVLLRTGRTAESAEMYNIANTLGRQVGKYPIPLLAGEMKAACKVSLLHARDQLLYLMEAKLIPESYAREVKAINRMLPLVPVQNEEKEYVSIVLREDHVKELRSYRRRLFVDDKQRVENGTTLQPQYVPDVEERYSQGEVIVLDNVLSPNVLQSLLDFARHSTIYYDAKPSGYVGSYFANGFNTPLLLQVAEELRTMFPNVFRNMSLEQAWAYNYDSEIQSGIKLHGDAAAVNCNLWLTPDDANLDDTSGGLIVYTKPAPLEWDFDNFNTQAGDLPMQELTKDSDSVTVPYRQNRMVMFKSDLLHATDTIKFKPGYKNRRINFTLLFGNRGEGEDAISIRQRQESSATRFRNKIA
eukprot:m.15277 g.15277  ORF g.15277 m.15277 type:complete len:500 (+) comp10512_c0_seq1:159-1658(+)